MSYKDIITILLGGAWIVFGLLLASGKLKLTIRYRDEEQQSDWPVKEEEETVDNYVKPLEMTKPPMIVETPKRKRGRPRRESTTPISPLS